MTDASTQLTIREDQTTFTDEQATALQHLGVTNVTRGDVDVFFHICKRTGLDPFAKQIYMIERQGKQTIQTGIDGFRLIADRTIRSTSETLGFEDTQWCGADGVWRDVWLSEEPPAAARVVVLRNRERFPGIALFTEYAARKRNGELMQMWATRPAGQLAKCAEALALRRAFPQDLSGLYTSDEMNRADSAERAEQQPVAQAEPQQEAAVQPAGGEPRRDVVAEQVEFAWNDPDALQKVGKWMRSAHPKDPRVDEIIARWRELTAAQEAEAAPETEETTTEADVETPAIIDEEPHDA